MQLLIEGANVLESEILEEINEASGLSQKNYYIKGIFSTPDKKNRNGRVYSTKLWENNVEQYQKHIKENTKYTLGELEHPSRVDPDPMLAVMKITELKMENGLVMGRAKILNDNSKETNKLKALIDEGYKIGVSSRGTGRMKGSIVEEFQLSTYDVVQSPSDYNANLSGLVESIETNVIMNESTGHYVCDEKGCSLETKITEGHEGHEDLALETKETKCDAKAKELIEALNNYSKKPVELTENEILAQEITEGFSKNSVDAIAKNNNSVKSKFIKMSNGDKKKTYYFNNEDDAVDFSKELTKNNIKNEHIGANMFVMIEGSGRNEMDKIAKQLRPLQDKAVAMMKKGDKSSPEFEKVRAQINKLADEFSKLLSEGQVKKTHGDYDFTFDNGRITMRNKGSNKILMTKDYPSLTSLQMKKMAKDFEKDGKSFHGIKTESTESMDEARQYNGKEILKQYDKAFDEMDELIYMVGQSDQEIQKRMVESLQELQQDFSNAGFSKNWKPSN